MIAVLGTARLPLLRRLLAFSVALSLLLLPAGARADSARPPVEVVIAAAPGVEAELTPVIAELLGRLQVDLQLRREATIDPSAVVTPPPAPSAALARVFIDATRSDVAVLYLVDSAWERMLVRRLALERGLDEVAREQLAHVVESAIQSLVGGGHIGVTRAEAASELGLALPAAVEEPRGDAGPLPAKPSTPPTSPPLVARHRAVPRARTLDARVGLGWGLAPWTPQTLVQGPQLKVAVGWRRARLSLGGGVLAQYLMEREVRSELAGMAIEGVGLRILAHARYTLERRFALRASLGAGFDRETFEPRRGTSASVLLGPSGTHTSAILAAAWGLEVCVAGPLWLGAEAGADFDLAPDDYVVLQGARFVAIAEPLRLRPTFSALLSLAL